MSDIDPCTTEYLGWIRAELAVAMDPETGEITPDALASIRERSQRVRDACGIS